MEWYLFQIFLNICSLIRGGHIQSSHPEQIYTESSDGGTGGDISE